MLDDSQNKYYKQIGRTKTDYKQSNNFINAVNTSIQTIGENIPLIFNATRLIGGKKINHVINSPNFVISDYGIFEIYFKVITLIPSGEAILPISLIMQLDNILISGTRVIVTPTALGQFHTLTVSTFVEIPKNSIINIVNTTPQPISFIDASISIKEIK